MMKHGLLTLNMSEEHLLRLSFTRTRKQTIGVRVLQWAYPGQVAGRRLKPASARGCAALAGAHHWYWHREQPKALSREGRAFGLK